MKDYGKEVIIDLHDCSINNFNRSGLRRFFKELCEKIGMQREGLHFYDDLNTPEEEKVTEPHLVGTSAIQFIRTSNVTIHTLTILKSAYINVFSCKDFELQEVVNCCHNYFNGEIVNFNEFRRV